MLLFVYEQTESLLIEVLVINIFVVKNEFNYLLEIQNNSSHLHFIFHSCILFHETIVILIDKNIIFQLLSGQNIELV